MSHVLHRSFLNDPRVAVGGDGLYIIDREGRRYLDACGGAAVSNLGHNHPRIVDAIKRQAETLPYAHTSFFTTPALEELADTVVSLAPGMDKALFVSGGSEAVEAALKLSRQHFVESGEPSRRLFIARKQSYHGNTLGALAIGGNEWRRKPFMPMLIEAHHISPCYEYRWRHPDEGREEFGLRVANELEAKIIKLGPENVAGFVAETVVGATIGAVAAVPGYFRRIREICDRYGVHLILDEVMCGTGRTGSLFAYEQEDIVPDIVTIAKGLAAGYQPIGAVLTDDRVCSPIRDGSGFFQHGHTFMGHTTTAAAALETLNVIRDENLLENVTARGESLRKKLREVLGDNPNVGDIRGRGLFIGVEFVKDRITKEPFPPEIQLHHRIKESAMHHGLLCYAIGGTIDGHHGNHVLLAPPYTITDSHVEQIVTKFASTLNDTMPVSIAR